MRLLEPGAMGEDRSDPPPCNGSGLGPDEVHPAARNPLLPKERTGREKVLEGLRLIRQSWAMGFEPSFASLDRAIAYLETDPAAALAEDYAARIEAEAETWEREGVRFNTPGWRHRAAGLREAARLLRDKEGR